VKRIPNRSQAKKEPFSIILDLGRHPGSKTPSETEYTRTLQILQGRSKRKKSRAVASHLRFQRLTKCTERRASRASTQPT